MSDRYTLFKINNLNERFHLPVSTPEVKRSYNISPTQTAPAIFNKNGTPQLEMMKWGFIPAGAKDANSVFRYKTFVARSEGIFTKPRWSDAIRHSRCLVPANGFYVWQIKDEKKPFYIRPKDHELFAFAGIRNEWQDADGKTWGTYSLVTVESNKALHYITDRMPVILKPEDESRWLDETAGDINTVYDIMRPYDGELIIDSVSADINSTKIDNPRLVTPLRAK